ncbi:MAG: hypothetical protein GC162_18320 [Planctomycetes bacterium]|nr:hypothetical protein [Planctomycetota bacterium]
MTAGMSWHSIQSLATAALIGYGWVIVLLIGVACGLGRKTWPAAGCVMLALAWLVMLITIDINSDRAFQQVVRNFSKVTKGMHQAEVLNLLGRPTSTTDHVTDHSGLLIEDYRVLYYSPPTSAFALPNSDNASIEDIEETYVDQTYRVYFDHTGRVTSVVRAGTVSDSILTPADN